MKNDKGKKVDKLIRSSAAEYLTYVAASFISQRLVVVFSAQMSQQDLFHIIMK